MQLQGTKDYQCLHLMVTYDLAILMMWICGCQCEKQLLHDELSKSIESDLCAQT